MRGFPAVSAHQRSAVPGRDGSLWGLLTSDCSSRHSCVVGRSARCSLAFRARLNAKSASSPTHCVALSSLAFSPLVQVRLELLGL